MTHQRSRIATAVAAVWLGGSLATAFAADPPSFGTGDYQQVGAAILESEVPPQQAAGTLFVGFVDAEASDIVPAFQARYPAGTVVKGEGNDGTWDTSQQRLVDRTTRAAATAVFISAPKALPDGDVAFGVTTESRDGKSHNGVYRFHRGGDAWVLSGSEPVR